MATLDFEVLSADRAALDSLVRDFFAAFTNKDTQGTKLFQFVRLPEGWRLSALAWADEPETGGRR